MNNQTSIRFSPDPATGFLSEDASRRYFSIVGYAAFALIAIHTTVQFALSYLISVAFPKEMLADPTVIAILNNLLIFIPLYLVALPVFLFILKRLPSIRPLKTPMGAGGFFGGLCCAFTVMMGGSYLSNFIIAVFESLMGRTLVNPVLALSQNSEMWIGLLFTGLLAPILEELIFRKLLCRRLLPLGEGYAILLSAAIFGLGHSNFFQFFYAFGIGCLFGLIYVKTGRIRYTVVYHIIINVLGGILAPWLLEHLDPETLLPLLEEIMAQGTLTEEQLSALSPYLLPSLLLLGYEAIVMGGALIGSILLFIAILRRRLKVDSGLLPPPKKGRIGNILLTPGVALAIAAFTVSFILSLLP